MYLRLYKKDDTYFVMDIDSGRTIVTDDDAEFAAAKAEDITGQTVHDDLGLIVKKKNKGGKTTSVNKPVRRGKK